MRPAPTGFVRTIEGRHGTDLTERKKNHDDDERPQANIGSPLSHSFGSRLAVVTGCCVFWQQRATTRDPYRPRGSGLQTSLTSNLGSTMRQSDAENEVQPKTRTETETQTSDFPSGTKGDPEVQRGRPSTLSNLSNAGVRANAGAGSGSQARASRSLPPGRLQTSTNGGRRMPGGTRGTRNHTHGRSVP